MRMKVEDAYKGAGIDYIFRQLQKYDTRKLQYIHVKTSRSKSSALHVYGNHRINWDRREGKVTKDGRINISVKKGVSFPNTYKGTMARMYGGSKFYCQLANNLDEALVAVGMHEVYHYLCYTGQLGGNNMHDYMRLAKDEVQAMKWGWVHMACFRQEQARLKGLVAA